MIANILSFNLQNIIFSYLLRGLSVILAFLQGSFSFFGIEVAHQIEIDETVTYQTFESFGTSSAWWSDELTYADDADYIASMLYGEDGLNLDVYRFNIGSGSADNENSRITDEFNKTESFYVYNETTGEYEYDFSQDANAIAMMEKAIEYGASEIILFCNSPHYSMTNNGDSAGSEQEYYVNLPQENYDDFVDYVLTIADWFVEQGYPVTAISPINEPQWSWSGENVTQEGCHYELDEAVELMEMFATQMQERGCEYELSGIESGQMSMDYWDYFESYFDNDVINDFCDTYSGHSYWIDGDVAGKYVTGLYFAENYPDKSFEMSEWCELPQEIDAYSIESGIYMANIIVEDLSLLNAVSWQSWTAVNGDGVINRDLSVLNRYYAYKQFSAFIESGMVRVDVSDSLGLLSELASVAFTDGEKTVYVVVNDSDNAVQINFNNDYETSSIYQTSSSLSCEMIYSGPFETSFNLESQSITTFVFE
ncbi:MAG: glycoside hydrolase [Clostridia bacterium]